jgi:hypothetical protein
MNNSLPCWQIDIDLDRLETPLLRFDAEPIVKTNLGRGVPLREILHVLESPLLACIAPEIREIDF